VTTQPPRLLITKIGLRRPRSRQPRVALRSWRDAGMEVWLYARRLAEHPRGLVEAGEWRKRVRWSVIRVCRRSPIDHLDRFPKLMRSLYAAGPRDVAGRGRQASCRQRDEGLQSEAGCRAGVLHPGQPLVQDNRGGDSASYIRRAGRASVV